MMTRGHKDERYHGESSRTRSSIARVTRSRGVYRRPLILDDAWPREKLHTLKQIVVRDRDFGPEQDVVSVLKADQPSCSRGRKGWVGMTATAIIGVAEPSYVA